MVSLCPQDHLTLSCGHWLPMTPMLGTVTYICVSLSEEGTGPGPGECSPHVAKIE